MVMSSQRCVAPQRRKVATQNSRPARTASASMFSVCVVMGERVPLGAPAPGEGNRSPHAIPAISAAALSHWQPALMSPSGRPITMFDGTGTQAFFPRGGGLSGHRFMPGMWVAGLRLPAVTPADPRARRGAGHRRLRRNPSLMGDLGIAAGAIRPIARGHKSHHGDRRFPVPQRDRVGGPEARAALLAFRACQPPQPVELATRQRVRGHGCLLRQAPPDWCGAKCMGRSRTTRSVSGVGRQSELAPRCRGVKLSWRWREAFLQAERGQ